MAQKFDTSLADSQNTAIEKILPEDFDLLQYHDYEQQQLEKNEKFVSADRGLLVYRRVRADGVFYDKCRDHQESLARQLGGLQKSLAYKADIANFLEPWYGIGYIASCFGGEYIWNEGQAPAVNPVFDSVDQLLDADYVPVHQSSVGKVILERIEYFLEKTRGLIPLSFSDVQAPVNMFSYLVPLDELCVNIVEDPEIVKKAAELLGDLQIEFLKEQEKLIGDVLVRPGHGFASSRAFRGVGESTDNVVMFSEEQYRSVFQSVHEKLGREFGGLVFHSCGNWAAKAEMVKSFAGLLTVDGAFSPATDPICNKPDEFRKIFANSAVVVNARCVGNAESVLPYFKELIGDDMKVIAVTYCQDAADQEKLYDRLHSLTDN